MKHRLQLAQSQFEFEGVELVTHYFLFSGIKRPKSLSRPVAYRSVDLSLINGSVVDETVRVRATKDGVLNSVRISSPVQVYGEITFDHSDSLMPHVVVPLEQDLPVSNGDLIEVNIAYTYETSWEEVQCTAKRL